MSRKSLVTRIHKAVQARLAVNRTFGCIDPVNLIIGPDELYSALHVTRLHVSTMNGVAGDLVKRGYDAKYSQTHQTLTVSYDPADDYLNFISLTDLEESVGE